MRRIQKQSHQFHGSQQQANHKQRTPNVKLGLVSVIDGSDGIYQMIKTAAIYFADDTFHGGSL
jgi:hypothetical protein